MSLTDYSNIENEISNAAEPHILQNNTEIKARIVSVRSGVSEKNNAGWFSVIFDVLEDPMVIPFSDFFWDLSDGDKLDSKSKQQTLYRFKQFAGSFGIDYSKPFSWTDDLPGLEGYLVVGVRNSDQYGEQNTVRRYTGAF